MTSKIEQVVNKIIEELILDITDRRGLKQEWNKIDKEVMNDEILPRWSQIIAQQIDSLYTTPEKEYLLSDDGICANVACGRIGLGEPCPYTNKMSCPLFGAGKFSTKAQLSHCQPIIEAQTRKEVGEWLEKKPAFPMEGVQKFRTYPIHDKEIAKLKSGKPIGE